MLLHWLKLLGRLFQSPKWKLETVTNHDVKRTKPYYSREDCMLALNNATAQIEEFYRKLEEEHIAPLPENRSRIIKAVIITPSNIRETILNIKFKRP